MEFVHVMNQAISHKAKLENIQKDYDDNLSRIMKNQADLSMLIGLYNTTTTALEYLETLIKEESTKFIKKIRDILDYGVKTIFYDEDYSIDIMTVEDRTSIHLITKDEFENVINPDIKNCGGGIRSCVGIILQLYFLFHYKAEPIIFVDEGFSQVSSQYIPYLMGLLQELSERNGLKILLITHDVRMMSYADKVYTVESGKAVLRKDTNSNVKVVGGEDSESTN